MQCNRIFDIFKVIVNVNLGSSFVTHRCLQDHWTVTTPLSVKHPTLKLCPECFCFQPLLLSFELARPLELCSLHLCFQVRVGKLDQKLLAIFFFFFLRRGEEGTGYSCLTEAQHVGFMCCILAVQKCPSRLVWLCFFVFRS